MQGKCRRNGYFPDMLEWRMQAWIITCSICFFQQINTSNLSLLFIHQKKLQTTKSGRKKTLMKAGSGLWRDEGGKCVQASVTGGSGCPAQVARDPPCCCSRLEGRRASVGVQDRQTRDEERSRWWSRWGAKGGQHYILVYKTLLHLSEEVFRVSIRPAMMISIRAALKHQKYGCF